MPTSEKEEVLINLNSLTQYNHTEIPKDFQDYYLYAIENLSDSPSDEFVLVESNRGSAKLLEIGYMDIHPVGLEKDRVNAALKQLDKDTLSDDEWEEVNTEFKDMTQAVIRDRLYDGVLQLYANTAFTDIADMEKAMQNRLSDQFTEEYQAAIGQAIEQSTDWVEQQSPIRKETMFSSYKITGDDIDDIPFVEHCQLKAELRFTEYPMWRVTALEYKHQSIIRDSDLAKTKALLDHEYSRSEIAETLSITYREVTKRCQQIENLYQRLNWTQENIEF